MNFCSNKDIFVPSHRDDYAMSFKNHIPNILTCTNLICGCLAIVAAFKWDLTWASYLVGIAALLDFLDGMSSRLFNAYSGIGKELDSLADMVSFGVVPGIIMYQLIADLGLASLQSNYVGLIALLIPVFSALRLAKFNIDMHQKDSFTGLPTPANAILLSSLPLVFIHDEMQIAPYLNNIYFLTGLTIVSSLLMVSKIRMFSLKIPAAGNQQSETRNQKPKTRKIKYVFWGVSLVLLISIHFTAIPVIIVLYIILSIFSV